jgi:hypothetical protein
MVLVLPLAVIWGGIFFCSILGAVLQSGGIASLGMLFALAGTAWMVIIAIQMINELKAVTRNAAFPWWPIFVPVYSLYWAWLLVPQEVAKAKQMMGVQAPLRNIVLYIFLWPYALASDINDLVR